MHCLADSWCQCKGWSHYWCFGSRYDILRSRYCSFQWYPNLSQVSTHPTYLQNLFSSTAAMGNPHRHPSKSHDDHGIFDGWRWPPLAPQQYHLHCYAISTPLRVNCLENGTHSIDSLWYHHPTILQEIPTRISPSTPAATVVDHHDDDDDQQLHQTHPDLSPTQNKPNSIPQFLSPQPTTDNYVDHTLNKINKMMCSWPSAIACKQWMMTLPMATPLPPTQVPFPSQLSPNSTIPDSTQQDFTATESSITWHSNNGQPQPHDVQQPLLSLQDMFVFQLKVVEKLNQACNEINNILDLYLTTLTHPPTNLNPCHITPTCTTPATISNLDCPSLLPEPTPALVHQKPHTAPVWNKIIIYMNPILAKPPFSHDCHHQAPIQTKDQMQPP